MQIPPFMLPYEALCSSIGSLCASGLVLFWMSNVSGSPQHTSSELIKKIPRNLRKEIVTKAKYFFHDVEVRNAVISQFNALEDRNDVVGLFENFVVMERLKANAYLNRLCETYFWRTYEGQEIDMVEERAGKLFGYEIKWSARGPAKVPKLWKSAYPKSRMEQITRESFLSFVLEKK